MFWIIFIEAYKISRGYEILIPPEQIELLLNQSFSANLKSSFYDKRQNSMINKTLTLKLDLNSKEYISLKSLPLNCDNGSINEVYVTLNSLAYDELQKLGIAQEFSPRISQDVFVRWFNGAF